MKITITTQNNIVIVNLKKTECPLKNKCNLNNIIYLDNILTIKDNINNKAYIDITSLNWKFRYHNHLQSFKNLRLKNQTALSKYY